jgi:hypothetical protein
MDQWRDRIRGTVITVVMTALGTIGYQSAKYIVVDFDQQIESIQRPVDELHRERERLRRSRNDFQQLTKVAEERSRKRNDYLAALFQKQIQPSELRRLNKEARGMLVDAHSDIGTISGYPAENFDRAYKDEFTKELRAQVELLEIVSGLRERDLTSSSKVEMLNNRVLQGELHALEASSASSSSLKFARSELESELADMDAKWNDADRQFKSAKSTMYFSYWKLVVTAVLYVLILLISFPQKKEEKPRPIMFE